MKFAKKIIINKRTISLNHPTYFIADIAANHDSNLNRAKDLIWKAKKAGADAVKFQHFLAEKIVSDYGFRNLGEQLSHQKKWKKSVFDTYKKYSLNREWNLELINTAKKAKIDWFTTPYDYEAVNNLNKYLYAYKIGSGDITWLEFIEFIAKKKKPIFIACGASTINEIKKAINAIVKNKNNRICLMQCNTNYNLSKENFKYINLNVLNSFKKKFPGIILGLSDHTSAHATVLGAISLGARIVEKHFTDDNRRQGPDHSFSMTPKKWIEMIERARELEMSLGSGIKKIEKNEQQTYILQRRCIRLIRNMRAGEKITCNDIEHLRPAPKNAFKPFEKNKIVGKIITKNKEKGSELYKSDIS